MIIIKFLSPGDDLGDVEAEHQRERHTQGAGVADQGPVLEVAGNEEVGERVRGFVRKQHVQALSPLLSGLHDERDVRGHGAEDVVVDDGDKHVQGKVHREIPQQVLDEASVVSSVHDLKTAH